MPALTAEVSKTYDANGTLVATGVMSNGVTVYNDLVHSRSYEMPAIAIEGFHDWLHDVWTLPDRLVQEGFSDMGQGTLNGKTNLIYETTGTVTFDEAVGPHRAHGRRSIWSEMLPCCTARHATQTV